MQRHPDIIALEITSLAIAVTLWDLNTAELALKVERLEN